MIKLNAQQKKVLTTFPKFEDLQIAQLKKDPEYLRAYVRVALEDYAKDKNIEILKHALGIVVRALGATKVSKQIKVDRSGLYKSFTPMGNPSFDTVCGILDMAGIELTIKNSTLPARNRY